MEPDAIEELGRLLQDLDFRKTFDCKTWPLERNQYGLIVGPLRQCMGPQGALKKFYTSHAEAKKKASNLYPYECTFGRIHVSSKSSTRIIDNPQKSDHKIS